MVDCFIFDLRMSFQNSNGAHLRFFTNDQKRRCLPLIVGTQSISTSLKSAEKIPDEIWHRVFCFMVQTSHPQSPSHRSGDPFRLGWRDQAEVYGYVSSKVIYIFHSCFTLTITQSRRVNETYSDYDFINTWLTYHWSSPMAMVIIPTRSTYERSQTRTLQGSRRETFSTWTTSTRLTPLSSHLHSALLPTSLCSEPTRRKLSDLHPTSHVPSRKFITFTFS